MAEIKQAARDRNREKRQSSPVPVAPVCEEAVKEAKGRFTRTSACAADETAATSLKPSSLAEDVEKELTCAICLSRYSHPKLLPCLHAYCKECLENCLKTEKKATGRSKITCPQCKEVHEVSSEGVETFSSYFTINNLLELLHIHEANEGEEVNIQCTTGLDENLAVSWCSTCSCYLCHACWASHIKMVFTKEHAVVSLDEIRSSDKQTGVRTLRQKRYCPEHDDQLLRLYCRTCKKVVCQACAMVKHRSAEHDCDFVKDVKSEISEELMKLMECIQVKQEEFDSYCSYIDHVRSANAASLDTSEKEINKAFDSLKQILEARRVSLVTELRSAYAQEQKRIDAEAQSVDLMLGKVKSTIDFVQQLLANGSDVEVLSVGEQAKKNMERLKEAVWEKEANHPSLVHVRLDPQMELSLNTYGELTDALNSKDIIVTEMPSRYTTGEEVSFRVHFQNDELLRRGCCIPQPNVKIFVFKNELPCDVHYTRISEAEWEVSFIPHSNSNISVNVFVNSSQAQNAPLTVSIKSQSLWQCGPPPARQCGPPPARQCGPPPARQCGPPPARQCGPPSSTLPSW